MLIRKDVNISQVELAEHLRKLVHDAETISGERYFKHYLTILPEFNQIVLLEYMLWFLKFKYLRYIRQSNNERGKRKAMKK